MDHTNEFKQRYLELFDYIYRYILCRIPSKADAEDITANSLINAYEHLENYHPAKGDLRQYLIGIARHKIIDYWRSHQLLTIDIAEASDQLIDDSLFGLDYRIDQATIFKQLMDSLSPELRSLFVLRYIDGLTYEAIANLTKKNAGTIRKLFSDTHKHLRQKFATLMTE